MSRPHTIVVGAGAGGLVAALLLAARGERVTLFEQQTYPGGKMRQVFAGGVPIDAGPTVFTMRWVFDQIFADAGASLDAELTLSPLNILARHAWRNGEVLDLHADLAASGEAIGAFAGAEERRRFLAFAAEAGDIYALLREPFLLSQKPGPLGLAMGKGFRSLPAMMRINPFETLWKALGRHFRDPRLQQLFGRYATYCGSSPFQAPATLMLVAHVEQEGVWSIEGGMHRLAQVLAELAAKRGADIRYGTPVKRIVLHGGAVAGVETGDGEFHASTEVIFNGDANALASGLLGAAVSSIEKVLPIAARSLSAITWCVKARTSGFALQRHNVFFANDCYAEFRDLGYRPPNEPTVYVCAQDREGKVANAERLLILVNAPALGDCTTTDLHKSETAMRQKLQSCGLEIDWQTAETAATTPNDFARLFPATGGALYGRASHGWMASFQRPAAASKIPGLFLAGGSTHPGPGVPMAALSARLAVEALIGARPLMRRFHQTATAGGMSMR